MKNNLLIFKGNLKKRKLQFLLTGISIMLATLLLSTSIGIIKSTSAPFDIVFNKLKASHILMYFDQRSDDARKISDWFLKQPEIESVSLPTPLKTFNGPLMYKEKKIDIMIQIAEYTPNHLIQDQVQILEGTKKDHPGFNEIWIPSHLAQNNGIRIGDTIGLASGKGLYSLIVTATIVDPHFVSGLMNPTRAWVAPGELPLFVTAQDLNNIMLGIRLKDPNKTSELWQRFNDAISYSGSNLQYSLFKSTFLSVYQIISSVLLFFSLLAVIIAMFIINTTVSSQIFSDYKLIGIYKALGFTPKNVTVMYVFQFLLLLLVFIPLGLAGSYFIVKIIISSMLNSLGLTNYETSFAAIYAISTLIIALSVFITSLISGKKAGSVPASQAIRSGMPAKSMSTIKPSKLMERYSFPLSFLLGIRFITSSRRRSIISSVSFLLGIFMLVFSVNISNSFSRLKENKPAWGFDNGDIQVSLKEGFMFKLKHQQFMESLSAQPEIKTVMPFSFRGLSILSEKGKAIQEIYGRVLSGNIAAMGLISLEGRNPEKETEIALCVGTSNAYHKKVNDSIDVFLEGQKVRYCISGIYQDVSNMGQGFRLHEHAMKMLNPLYEPDTYSIKVKDGISVNEFKNVLQKQFGETINIEPGIEDRQAVKGIIASMKSTLFLLSVFFLSVMLITIWNDMVINIRESSRIFGNLKTIGFTPKQLRLVLLYKNLILFIIALFAGIPLALFTSPPLMNMMTQHIGLVKFPYCSNVWGTLMMIPVVLIFGLTSSWLVSARAKKVNPRILITE